MWRDEDFDASGNAGLASYQAVSFEGEDHLVHRRWADLEVALHVGFSWGAPEHVRISVDEGEVLALLFGEALIAGAASGA